MRFGSRNRFYKRVGFRLTLWYSALFIVSSIALSVVSYGYLSSSLRDNRKVIQSKLEQLVALDQQGGLAAIQDDPAVKRQTRRRNAFFVRILDGKNKVVFLSNPRLWNEFELESLDTQSVHGAWQYVPSRKDGDVLELTSARLGNGFLAQVGKPLEDRSEILEHYRDTIISVISGMVFIGLAGGAFLAFRALRPVRNLIQTTKSIVTTGRIDARVPVSGSGDEFDELIQLFNQMLERIEALIKAMKEALDNVAHDLRSPLARLRGVAEMTLQAEAHDVQYREALAGCIEESDRIQKLLDSLMDISEAETGTMRLQLERVAVLDAIDEVVDLYQYVAEDKNVSIAVACEKNVVISADRNRFIQVLANLLDNAIKYSLPGGQVSIKVGREDHRTTIAFEDKGIGVAPEESDKIWDRLYRGDKSRSQPGLGLGLSLVRAVMHAHNGQVDVQSSPDQGSVFTISFPANSNIG
jgi:signal transduction histidine kinase